MGGGTATRVMIKRVIPYRFTAQDIEGLKGKDLIEMEGNGLRTIVTADTYGVHGNYLKVIQEGTGRGRIFGEEYHWHGKDSCSIDKGKFFVVGGPWGRNPGDLVYSAYRQMLIANGEWREN